MKTHFHSILSACVAVVLIPVLFAGCGTEGGTSPQDVFAKIKQAEQDKDYETMVGCTDQESQEKLAAGMYMMAEMMKSFASIGGDKQGKEAGENIDRVLKKHGLTKFDPNDMQNFANDQDGAVKLIASKIKNKPAFVGDFISAMEKMDNGNSSSSMPTKFNGDLEDVKIAGDTATGTIIMKGRNEPINFVKENDRWKIKIDMDDNLRME